MKWSVVIVSVMVLIAYPIAAAQDIPSGIVNGLSEPPAQPGEDAWTFVADLKGPLWNDHAWAPRTTAAGEADLGSGVRVDAQFPDSDGLLTTAYADFSDFLAAGKIPQNGRFVIETGHTETSTYEAYRIEVTSDRCRILAADTEGIRRGIFHVEDMMLRAGGPFLPLGVLERKPFIKTRISRCFFGPINRPPKNRDELLNDVDYYPDQYLNRLAHEGINGLWLSILFKDLCKTSIVPEFGNHVDRRLAKLRKTVEKCRRHGIRIYLYTNEPEAWDADTPAIQRFPELAGTPAGWKNKILFCPWSDTAQQYLYEATNNIFSAVPHLGGVINITHGEHPTTCLSSVGATDGFPPACRVCAKKAPWEIIRQTLAPMAKGIHDANPEAELIAWLYMPSESGELADWVYDIPKHLPEKVVLQFNFESGVTKEVFGRGRKGGDYWLSTPGPSPRFERMANVTRKANAALSAKIQTGSSHEVATVPFVPVPGLLYQKFRSMRELGVTHVMLCWYFGNYPGVMNKAAGELSFEPFPKSENDFLHQLAGLDWGKHADGVVQAWQQFAEGYGHYPLTNHFQYWGPMHDGVVWPLLLLPQDAPLAPTWELASQITQQPYPPSGDRIGEALGLAYTLAEAIESCRMMSHHWEKGLENLDRIAKDPGLSSTRKLDIGVAKALGIQFRSGLNILRFYDLRERMVHEKQSQQLVAMDEIKQIVEMELKNDTELIELCRRDSRLGFHSEAEGYKYFPDKIHWRMAQLQQLLDTEIPSLREKIRKGVDVFAEYSGRKPAGKTAQCLYYSDIGRQVEHFAQDLTDDLVWQECSQSQVTDSKESENRWACCHDRESLYFLFDCSSPDPKSAKPYKFVLTIEPSRLGPCLNLHLVASGFSYAWPPIDYQSGVQAKENGWRGWMRIPFTALGIDPASPKPFRMNVYSVSEQGERAWMARHPWPYRLLLGSDNPADLGWLFFVNKQGP